MNRDDSYIYNSIHTSLVNAAKYIFPFWLCILDLPSSCFLGRAILHNSCYPIISIIYETGKVHEDHYIDIIATCGAMHVVHKKFTLLLYSALQLLFVHSALQKFLNEIITQLFQFFISILYQSMFLRYFRTLMVFRLVKIRMNRNVSLTLNEFICIIKAW